MSIWYHVVCLHDPSRATYVCDIEDDGGVQARVYDDIFAWRDSGGVRFQRTIGRRLRFYNEGGEHPVPVPVTIAGDRNRHGHQWRLRCGICPMNVEASDERLLVALNRLRPNLRALSQELIVEELGDDDRIITVTTRITTHVTPLKKLQGLISN